MAQFAGTASLSAGGASATVTGTFPAGGAYQVAITTAWLTQVAITGKTATQFVVTFGTPAPSGG